MVKVRILTNEAKGKWLGKGLYDEGKRSVQITSDEAPKDFKWVGANIKVESCETGKLVCSGVVTSVEDKTLYL